MFLYFIIPLLNFVHISSVLALFIRFSPSFYQSFLLFMLYSVLSLFSTFFLIRLPLRLSYSTISPLPIFRHSFYSCFIQSSSSFSSSSFLYAPLVSHPVPQNFLRGEFPKWIFFPSFLGHKTGGGSCRHMKHCWERPLGVPEERGSALEAS